MVAKPKPTKKDRLSNKQEVKEQLKLYRTVQKLIAVERDNNCCVFCWFIYGRVRRAQDVHHVFSRGKKAGDWREHYENLLCTCRACHPQPILTPAPDENLAYVEKVRMLANKNPMNMLFDRSKYVQQETKTTR